MACILGITTHLQSAEQSYLLPHFDKGFETFAELLANIAPISLYLARGCTSWKLSVDP
jgi:hypothetical protein